MFNIKANSLLGFPVRAHEIFSNSIARQRPTGLYYLYGDGTYIQPQITFQIMKKCKRVVFQSMLSEEVRHDGAQ